jgi:hypothetical protein
MSRKIPHKLALSPRECKLLYFFMRLSDNRFTFGFSRKTRLALLLCVSSLLSAYITLHANSEFEASANPSVTEGFALLEAGNTENALLAFDQALQADNNDLSAKP